MRHNIYFSESCQTCRFLFLMYECKIREFLEYCTQVKHWQTKRYIQHCRTLFTQTGSLIEFPTTKRERDSYYYFWLESVNGSWVNIYFISIRIQYSATFMSNSMIVVVEFYSVEGEIQLIFWSLWIPSDVCLIVCVKSWVGSFKKWVLKLPWSPISGCAICALGSTAPVTNSAGLSKA